jgi:tetratricopeptide (TPR) repeat protein
MHGSSIRIRREEFLGLLGLIIAIVLAYQAVWYAGFIWDDEAHLTENSAVIRPGGLKQIWTTTAAVYYPLVSSNFWLQHKLWGLNPLPYHLVNVVFHVMCGILLWQVLRQLKVKAAWLGAAIWALHPMQVESVAWITELKNTQSAFFYLLSILFFLKWREAQAFPQDERAAGAGAKYVAALLCAAAALLSKTSTVMLPVILALCEWWQDSRWHWRNVRALVPFGLLSFLAAAWTIWEQKFHAKAAGQEWAQTTFERFVIAGRDIWFYLGKFLAPDPLVFIYPKWKLENLAPTALVPMAAALAVLFFLWRKRDGPLRGAFFATTYFVVSLFPVLGFFNVYFFRYSFVADHFQYLASIGLSALLAAVLSMLASRLRADRHIAIAFVALLLLILGTLTWHQAKIYRDPDSLWSDTLAKNPACWMAHDNFGSELLRKGKTDDAIFHFQQSLAIKPDNAGAEDELGNALLRKGRGDDAITHYLKAVEIKPDLAAAHNDLGNALLLRGETDESIAHYLKAIQFKPDFAVAYNNLGIAYENKGKVDEATRYYREALALKPDYAEAHYNFACALRRLGQRDEAVAHLVEALRIKPDYTKAKRELEMLGVPKSD